MPTIYSIGVMTGTSCDGADLALMSFSQKKSTWNEYPLAFDNQKFPEKLRARLRNAQLGYLSVVESALLSRDYSKWLSDAINRFASKNNCKKTNTFLAIHGQTIWHEPQQGISIQLLEPALVAFKTSMTVICAFRQPDLARGGQGAPLVPLYHWIRASQPDFCNLRPFAIHNLGGIGNLTYITKNTQDLIAFDTGPGNALIDLAVEIATNGNKLYDNDGKIARSCESKINWKKLETLAKTKFFLSAPPKSTGRELFNEKFLKKLPGKGDALIANATAFTALTMADAYARFLKHQPLKNIFIAGGGAKNSFLIELFRTKLTQKMANRKISVSVLPENFAPVHSLEAMAFARLGFEAIRLKPTAIANTTGAIEDTLGGTTIVPAPNFLKLFQILNMS